MGLYKKAVKHFMSMGVHHDNFDLCLNSKYTRWNSVNMGPKIDIVGLFRQAALRHGLRFWRERPSLDQLQVVGGQSPQRQERAVCRRADGADPQYADLTMTLKIPNRQQKN